jgi:predicted ATPase
MGKRKYCRLTRSGWHNLTEKLVEHAFHNPEQFGSARLNVNALSAASGLHRRTVRAIVNYSEQIAGCECKTLQALCELCGYCIQETDIACPSEARGTCTTPRQSPSTGSQRSPTATRTSPGGWGSGEVGSLPTPRTSLISRPQQKEIRDRFASHRLVTLTGTGGIGKTRLAIQVAGEMQANFPDGVEFIDLTSIQDSTQVPWAVARLLTIPDSADINVLDRLTEALASRTMLLVLDNCEHVVEGCADLASALLRKCKNITILATSHESLRIAGEHPYRVPPLSFPTLPEDHSIRGKRREAPVSPESLLQYGAIQLFYERAQQVDSNFAVNNSNAPALASICRRLEGIPLAIELAAALKGGMTVEMIDAGLSDLLGLLTDGFRDADSRHRTLRAVIDWSYELLTDPEKTFLNRLSVFVGGWTSESAEWICWDEEIKGQGAQKLLLSLKNKSLLEFEEKDGQGRYRMLQMIRAYASEKLTPSPDAVHVRRKHLEFFLTLAEQGEQGVRGREQADWLNRLNVEHDNMSAALAACDGMEEEAETRMRFVGALCRFWYEAAYFNKGLHWCRLALQHEIASKDTRWRVKVLNGAGLFCCVLADYTAAKRYFEESGSILAKSHDPSGIAASLKGLGMVSLSQGDWQQARRQMEESLALFTAIGDTRGIAELCNNLGALAASENRLADAQDYLVQSLSNYRMLDDQWRAIDVQGNLASVYWFQEDIRALHELEDNLAACLRIGSRHASAYALTKLGDIYLFCNKFTQANEAYTESLSILQEVGDWYAIPLAFANLGNVAVAIGDFSKAQDWYEQCLAERQRAEDRVGILHAHARLGAAARSQQAYERAREHYDLALTGFREIQDTQGIAFVQNGLGSLALRQGDFVEALACFRESLLIYRDRYRELGVRRDVSYAFNNLALLAAAQGMLLNSPEELQRAAQLWGAESTLRETLYASLSLEAHEEPPSEMQACKDALGEAAWNRAWEAGRALPLDQALEYALMA